MQPVYKELSCQSRLKRIQPEKPGKIDSSPKDSEEGAEKASMGIVTNPFGIQSAEVFSVVRTVPALQRANTYLHCIKRFSLFIRLESPNVFTLDTKTIIIGQTYKVKTPACPPEALISCLP